jgi:hypothetical protein
MLLRLRSIMIQHLLLASLIALPIHARAPQADPSVRARFQALHEKGDREGCAALWKERPAFALLTIEQDLDEALAKKTAPKDADLPGAAKLEERALWGAKIARDALAAPLIADLAAARIGWSEKDLGFYRDERRILERAKASLEQSDDKHGEEAAHEAVSRSLALGDWHGAATAYETCAIAYQGLSGFDDALLAWSQARMLYRELRLADRELACLRGALDMCFTAERNVRGCEIADQAVAAAHAMGDRTAESDFLIRRAGFEAKLGRAAQAEASRKEAKSVGK